MLILLIKKIILEKLTINYKNLEQFEISKLLKKKLAKLHISIK